MPCTRSRSLRRSCWKKRTANVKVRGKTPRRESRTASTTLPPTPHPPTPTPTPTPHPSPTTPHPHHTPAYLAGGRQRILGEAQRVDLTAMPVYTVDDADTVETDDGISIEPLQPDGMRSHPLDEPTLPDGSNAHRCSRPPTFAPTHPATLDEPWLFVPRC